MSGAHRELNFRKFVSAVPPDLLQRYFEGLAIENAPSGWATMNGDELDRVLSLPENSAANAIIRKDMQRINDLCGKATNIVVETYERHGIPFDPSLTPEHHAIRLFLDHEEAWGYAWSRFLLYGLGGRVDTYFMPAGKLNLTTEALAEFKKSLKDSFDRQGKGDQCEVQHYDDRGHEVFYVERGWYMQAYSHWDDEAVAIKSYRPALDDVVAYDPESGDLLVKAPHQTDRHQYVRAFAKCLVGDVAMGEQALQHKTFDLSPIREGQFNYNGTDQIARVALVGIRLQLPHGRSARLDLRSPDVRQTLRTMPGLTLHSGQLVSANLCFFFYTKKGRQPQVTFEVNPPSRTDLPDTVYSGLINAYLRQQGIKLR